MASEDQEYRRDGPCDQAPRVQAAPKQNGNDKVHDWKIVSARIRRHGYNGKALPDAKERHCNGYHDSEKHRLPNYNLCRKSKYPENIIFCLLPSRYYLARPVPHTQNPLYRACPATGGERGLPVAGSARPRHSLWRALGNAQRGTARRGLALVPS